MKAAREWIARHPRRWHDLMTEGHEYWRRHNPQWRQYVIKAAAASAQVCTRPPTSDQLSQLQYLRCQGLSWRRAAYVMGISHSRLYRWMRRGLIASTPTVER